MLDTIWLEARRLLRSELPEKDYDTWIVPLQATEWSASVLTLEAPSGFFRDWLRRHFLPALEQAVSYASGAPATVALVVNRVLDVPAATPRLPRREAARAGAPEVEVPNRYTFDTFVVGTSNQVAYAAARAVVAQPGLRYNPLFLYGGVGLGKTHLLCAIAAGVAGERRHGRVLRISAEYFVNEMIQALRRDRMERFRQRFRGIATLVIDDIQFLADKRRSQEEFCHTFNALHDGQRQIVIASDRAPHEMPGIEEALRSRLGSGLLAHIAPPDPALRVALVRRKTEAAGLSLDVEVEAYLADGFCSNVRVLEGALTKIEAVINLDGRVIDLAVVRQVLGAPPAAPGEDTSVDRIIDQVCAELHVTRAELTSPRRSARVAGARHIAMYLCREHTDASLADIGAKLHRDHSTVVHGLKITAKRLRESAELRRVVAGIRARLRK